jgi:Fic family protein
LSQSGLQIDAYKHIHNEERQQLAADLLSEEALKTSEIENEYLNRESLRSSLRRQFGLTAAKQKFSPAEQGITGLMADLHENFSAPLTEQTLFAWHALISQGRTDFIDIGRALSEKALSQSLRHPALTSLSQTIHKNKKAYYDRLELNNKTMDIDD